MKVVLDSNVYIAAILAKGLASDVIKFGEKGEIEIYTSEEILSEVREKLIKKAKLEELYVKQLLSHVEKSLKIIRTIKKLVVVKEDPDDNKILECAVEAGANLIITMDKHLLKLKSYEGIGIVHPKTLTWIIPKLLG